MPATYYGGIAFVVWQVPFNYMEALFGINIKKLQSTFKRSCYRPCSHRSKTAKIKREREGEEKGIAEIVHLMKPITRSPDTTSSSSSSSSSSNK
jgi:hypothetical protein